MGCYQKVFCCIYCLLKCLKRVCYLFSYESCTVIILARKFYKCTAAVKTVLFRSYCICLYDAALWTNFKVGMLNKLRSCYNRCIKIFFGYSCRDSVTSILFNLGLPSFDTLMKNASVSYSCLQKMLFFNVRSKADISQLNCCSNRLVVHMCQLSVFWQLSYHCEFSVCVTFFCHCSACMSVCLVLWAWLPDIKIDDDDDDDYCYMLTSLIEELYILLYWKCSVTETFCWAYRPLFGTKLTTILVIAVRGVCVFVCDFLSVSGVSSVSCLEHTCHVLISSQPHLYQSVASHKCKS